MVKRGAITPLMCVLKSTRLTQTIPPSRRPRHHGPIHGARDISPILLRQIAKDIGLTIDQLLEHR